MENEENSKNDLGKKSPREQKVVKDPEEKAPVENQVVDLLKYLDLAFNDCFKKLQNNELESQYEMQKAFMDHQEIVRKNSEASDDKESKEKLLEIDNSFQSAQAEMSKKVESNREEIQNGYTDAIRDLWKRVQAENPDLPRLIEVSQYFNDYANRGIHLLQIK